MYESSCSYQGALELKRSSGSTCPLGIKTEEFGTAADWPAYRFCNPSTFEQLKQSVEKAKAALQDRSGFLGTGSAFSDLYSGVSTTGRSQENLQDNGRTRESGDNDTKRLSQGNKKAAHKRNGDIVKFFGRNIKVCTVLKLMIYLVEDQDGGNGSYIRYLEEAAAPKIMKTCK
ncbi:hypothetical protein Zmor_005627 [Zophobas morio]|uniref:Uncharacterized protein n=1 Tax=Zophobas morio TaxID=2755281 RepID=A0AA38MKV4_9CUCU|nr:hypothetical protein Zmor_005627 [Zophobas morio]